MRAFAVPNACTADRGRRAAAPRAARRRRCARARRARLSDALRRCPNRRHVHFRPVPVRVMVVFRLERFAGTQHGDHTGHRPERRAGGARPHGSARPIPADRDAVVADQPIPLDVVHGLLSVLPFRTLYVADLDAIERRGDNDAVLGRLKAAFPRRAFWVDNGLAEARTARRGLTPVISCSAARRRRDAGLGRQPRRTIRASSCRSISAAHVRGPPALLATPDALAGARHRDDASHGSAAAPDPTWSGCGSRDAAPAKAV